MSAENDELRERVGELESREQELANALDEANEHIRQAASDIVDAQDFTDGSCAELKDQILSIDEPQEVQNPAN
jgi:hypothetical protein